MLVVWHYERAELTQADEPAGLERLRRGAEAWPVDTISLRERWRVAVVDSESDAMQPDDANVKSGGAHGPYRDSIHLNAAGQRSLAEAVEPWLLRVLRDRPAAEP